MVTRQISHDEYDTILIKWWERWKWTPPTKESLPSEGDKMFSGTMISKDEVDICAGFIYYTNSNMAWIEFIISNPDYKEDDRAKAIEQLIEVLSLKAKDLGFRVLWTCVVHENLKNKYINCGFQETQKGATELIKIL